MDAISRLRKRAQNEATCIALNDLLKASAAEVRELRARLEEAKEENARLAGICGELSDTTPYYTNCPSCGQRWATSLGSKFECLSCGEYIIAKPELKIVE